MGERKETEEERNNEKEKITKLIRARTRENN